MAESDYTFQGPHDPLTFCSKCGAALDYRIPTGDDRQRFVCDSCCMVHYQNPKMVVGAIPVFEDRILLCERAIEPAYGKWTLPAGYLENGEAVEEGAIRETREEAGAAIEIVQPYALFSLTFVSHIYLMFLARMNTPDVSPGKESLSVRFFAEDEIPWEKIAFAVIKETLKYYFLDRTNGQFLFHIDDIAQK